MAAAAQRDLPVVLAALDELTAADLVRAGSVPRRFAFRHPIVRAALYQSATAGWLLGAHDRAARALAAAGASAATRAPHVERAAAGGDAAAAALLAEAGTDSLGRAPAEAAHWFSAALRLLPATANPARRIEVALARAEALSAAGRLVEARTVLDEILAVLAVEDVDRRARLLAACAGLDNLLGQHGRARARLLGALDTLAGLYPAAAARAKIGLAADCYYAGEFDEMRRWEHDARRDATTLGDPGLLAAATSLVAGADYLTADVEASRGAAAETSRLLDLVDDAALSPHLVTLTWFGWTEAHLGDLAHALSHLDRIAGVARSTGQAHLVPLIEVGRVYALAWSGRLAEAGRAADTAFDAAMFSGSTLFPVLSTAARAWTALLTGDLRAAVRYGEEAVAAAGPDPDAVSATAWYSLAEARIEAGDPERGRDELLAAARGADLPLIERPYRPRWYGPHPGRTCIGNPEAAARWAARAEAAAAGPAPIALRAAEAALARAAVTLACGDAAEAAVAALRAAELADQAAARVTAARARVLSGRALARAGRHVEAADELRAAETELGICGARRYRDEAARELRRLGRPVSRGGRTPGQHRAVDGVDVLSRRERQVAELVADGRTNRQIAGALFVSDRTIETHLAKIFAKLGVTSRAAVAESVGRVRA